MSTARVVIKGYDELKNPLKQAENELTGFQSVAEKVGQTLKTAFAVGAIIKGVQELSRAVADCVNEFKAQIEVDTRLDAIIKATNQQYIATTATIKKYASSLQQVTRFGDDAIESAASLLLATKKFSKEGLERTLELSADLAEAMGTDITSAASTLERALVAPGEGLNRLKSIGITFTDAEEDMIMKMNEAGLAMEAQQAILDKVEQAYGGVAKSVASIDTSKLDKIKSVWSDIKEDLGKIFSNTLGKVFNLIYEGLVRLERLAAKVANDMDFNKAIASGDIKAMAAFDEEDLRKRLSEYNEQLFEGRIKLEEDYKDIFDRLLTKLGMGLDDFFEKTYEEQRTLLAKIMPEDEAGLMVNNFRDLYGDVYDITTMIQKALTLQKQQADFSFNLLTDSADKLVDSADKLSNSKFFTTTWDSILIKQMTGLLGPSGTLNTMLGSIGTNFLNSQTFMDIGYNWYKDYEGNAASTNGKFNFSTKADFGLTSNNAMQGYNTMSILGPGLINGVNASNPLDVYGALSKSFRIDELTRNIDTMKSLAEVADVDTKVYYDEIISSLEDQYKELTKIEKDQKTFIEKIGEKVGAAVGSIFGADDDQSKAAGSAIINSFTSQMGEAGDVVARLATNMATMGPALGAIVTALHYVIGGLMENLKDLFNDFVQWGIQPLMEFGRMIGSILKPILEEIMPSVVASGKVLMQLFQAIARVLTPIVQILMRVLGPVLSVLADVVVTIVGTISWACDWIAYAITWVLNKISLGFIQQSANPGSLSSYLEGMYANPADTYTGSGSTSSTGLTSAAYSGGTVIHLNVYQQGVVCGDSGIQEFAVMIKNELADVAYYGR